MSWAIKMVENGIKINALTSGMRKAAQSCFGQIAPGA